MRSAIAALILAMPLAAQAQVPANVVIDQEGRLLDSQDAPVTGSVAMTFSLFDEPTDTGHPALWSDSYTETFAQGVYSVALGDTAGGHAPLPARMFTGPRWLEIAVAGQVLAPRLRIGEMPESAWADAASDSLNLGGIPAARYALQAGVDALSESTAAAIAAAVQSDRSYSDSDASSAVSFVDSQLAGYAKLSGAAFNGEVTVQNPKNAPDAANKGYVDSQLAGVQSSISSIQSSLAGVQPICAGMLQSNPAASCQSIYANCPGAGSRVYWLQPPADSSPFQAYCDMANDGGGWTLVAKLDGNQQTWAYGSAHWTTNDTFGASDPAFDRSEAKIEGFNTMPFSALRLGMVDANVPRWLVVSASGSSLLAKFKAGFSATSASRAGWYSLMSNPQTEPNCNQEGFDSATATGDGVSVRLGIITNNEFDCNTPDSYIGYGGQASPGWCINAISVGDIVSTSCGGSTNESDPTFGYIEIR